MCQSWQEELAGLLKKRGRLISCGEAPFKLKSPAEVARINTRILSKNGVWGDLRDSADRWLPVVFGRRFRYKCVIRTSRGTQFGQGGFVFRPSVQP